MRAADNPFRVQRLHSLAFRPQGIDWPALMHRLNGLGRRAAIVGPEGTGKTTLLRELGGRLKQQGYRTRWLQVGRDRRLPRRALAEATTDLGARDVVLFDGAGHLLPPRWWWLRRRCRDAGGLIITAHFGRRLPVLLRTRTDAALLCSLIAELLPDVSPAHWPADPQALLHRHGGNVREALFELYDRFARMPAVGPEQLTAHLPPQHRRVGPDARANPEHLSRLPAVSAVADLAAPDQVGQHAQRRLMGQSRRLGTRLRQGKPFMHRVPP